MDAGPDFGIDGLSGFKEVGAGGFAITYSAYEADQDRIVAVKVLHEADDDARRRFDRERRTMGNTTGHANIVTLFRSGYTSIGNKPYMVMEYLAGGSLQDRLDRSGPVELGEAVDLLLPVAEALGFSHLSGIVHKDVKPANILVSASGAVKLTDFGIAALRESTTSQVAYSPSYAPPESFDAYRDANDQLVDLRDRRSDLYSLAASLFTLVTATPPFDGTQLAMMRQIAETPVPTTGHAALDAFLNVAMAKRPEHRFQTAEAFIAALRALRANPDAGSLSAAMARQITPEGAPVAPRPRPLTGDGAHDRDPRTIPSQGLVDDGPRPPSRRLPVVAFLSFLGLAMVGVIAAALIMADGSSSEETPDVEQAGDAKSAVDVNIPDEGGVITFAGHTDGVRATVELPDGRIASAGEDRVLIWDPGNPEAAPASYDGHGPVFSVLDMILLSDGRVASADSRAVRIWDPANPEVTLGAYGDTEGVGDGLVGTLVELPDGRIASSNGSEINIWHPSDPATTLGVYIGHESGLVRTLTMLPDGRLASAVGPNVHIWSPDDPTITDVIYRGHDNSEALQEVLDTDDGPPPPVGVWVNDVVGLPDGRIVSAGRDGFQNPIHIWDPESPDTPLATRVLTDPATALLVMADGRIASSSDSGGVSIWSADQLQDADADFTGHSERIWSLSQLTDGRLITTSDDETVQIWDPSCEGIDPGYGPFEELLCR